MWPALGNFAALATLLGVSFSSLLDSSGKGYAALAAVVATCLFVCFQAYRWAERALTRRYPQGYANIASFMRYTTGNGTDYVYEQFRHIQIKKPFSRYFDHNFTWSGTTAPRVDSSLQETGEVRPRKNGDGSDGSTVQLKFDSTRLYNDSEIVHLKMALDDSDQASSPHLSQTVMSPLRLLHYRVELLHAPPGYAKCIAKLGRRPADQAKADYEHLLDVPFDLSTKSYACQLPNPEPGYEYRLMWDRPVIRKRGKNNK